jgi:hypothetical protein
MRSHLCSLISALLFLTAAGSSAQVKQTSTDHLLARLSYSNTLMDQSNDRARKVCFAVYDSGLYRLWRPGHLELRPKSPDSGRFVLQGTLTKAQMRQLGAMLKDMNFKSSGGGLIEQGSESFLAELVKDGKSVRYKWIDPDYSRAFPQPVDRLIDWLQDFEAVGSTRIQLHELSDIAVCPSANVNPLPLVSGLDHPGGSEPQTR